MPSCLSFHLCLWTIQSLSQLQWPLSCLCVPCRQCAQAEQHHASPFFVPCGLHRAWLISVTAVTCVHAMQAMCSSRTPSCLSFHCSWCSAQSVSQLQSCCHICACNAGNVLKQNSILPLHSWCLVVCTELGCIQSPLSHLCVQCRQRTQAERLYVCPFLRLCGLHSVCLVLNL
jgi:hypothetical protein